RPHRPPVHRPDRSGRLLAAPGARRHLCALGYRGRDPQRQAVDAGADLAGRHPQEGVTPSRDEFVLRTATMGTAMPTADPTPPGGDDPVVDALWKAHRRRMLAIAFRILLDLGDAEDVVQEAFSRLARSDVAAIDDPEAWLVGGTSRRCVDRLGTGGRRPTAPPEVAAAAADSFNRGAVDPADQVTLVDNVTLAMHGLLERLSPAERTSFVLHDVFQYPFEEVATIVGRSPGAGRQLARRARRAVERGAGGGPVSGGLGAATTTQRAVHRGLLGWRPGRVAGTARPRG